MRTRPIPQALYQRCRSDGARPRPPVEPRVIVRRDSRSGRIRYLEIMTTKAHQFRAAQERKAQKAEPKATKPRAAAAKTKASGTPASKATKAKVVTRMRKSTGDAAIAGTVDGQERPTSARAHAGRRGGAVLEPTTVGSKPTRKSTRKSADHTRQANSLQLKAVLGSKTPSSRAVRGVKMSQRANLGGKAAAPAARAARSARSTTRGRR
jgi:hypothetical protein